MTPENKRKWAIRFLVMLVLFLGVIGWVGLNAKPRGTEEIENSREVSFVVGDFRGGLPDYIGSRNRRRRKGVTATANAGVLLVHAVGPESICPQNPKALLSELGISEKSGRQRYFVELGRFLKHPDLKLGDRATRIHEKFLKDIFSGSFKAAVYPNVVDWLTLNKRQLKLLQDASTKPHLYLPWIGEQPKMQGIGDAALAFACRAMISLERGNVDAAIADAQTLFRFGRLIGKSADCVVVYLTGVTIHAFGSMVIGQVSKSPKLQESHQKQLSAIFEDHQFPAIDEVVGYGERIINLSAGIGMVQLKSDGRHTLGPHKIEPMQADVNSMLRQVNVWYDKLTEATNNDTFEKRRDAIKGVKYDLEAITDAMNQYEEGFFGRVQFTFMSSRGKSQRLGKLAANMIMKRMMPDIERLDAARSTAIARSRLAQLGSFVAIYRSKHGKPPESLDKLTPNLLTSIPNDPFVEKPFIYQVSGSGCTIYSVGRNQKDDDAADKSDIVFTLPAK